jgi:excisionase family DNA binding protein
LKEDDEVASDTGTRPLMDLPSVARRLGVNQRHIRRLVAERRIPYLKWGHLLRFDPADIDAWLDTARRAQHVSASEYR